jgi:ADP-heptose:LPS heptosyltransferase
MQNLLFVELLGGIGDLLIALPAIQAMGRSYPTAKLTVLTFAPAAELLNHDPLIDQVITIAHEPNSQPDSVRQKVEAVLEHHSFDLIVSDTNYGEIDQLIQRSGAARVVTNLWRSPPSNQRVGDRFRQILLAEGVIRPEAIASPQLHLTATEIDQAQQRLGNVKHPIVVLISDAGMMIKRWSTDRFVALGQALQQQYGATVIVSVGSDRKQAVQIVEEIGDAAIIWERGTLRELTAVLAIADLAIAPDTGLAHIAAALDTPIITLFGPSWSDRYGQPPPHVNLQGYPGCPERNIGNFTLQCCWDSGMCPFEGWQTCLEAISSEDVLFAAATLLETPSLNSQLSPFDRVDRPFNLHAPTFNLQSPTSKLDTLTSELDTLTSESKTSTSNLQLPTSDLENPTSELKSSPLNLELLRSLPHLSSLTPHWSSAQNILAIRLDNIGDVLMTSPALQAIKETLPNSRITLMASPSGSQAAALLPWIDDVITVRSLWQDLGKLEFDPAREWELIQTVRDRQFDAAIVFTSFSQTPHAAGYLCYLAGIPLRAGESKEWGGSIFTTEIKSAPDQIHQVERNLRLVESIGFCVSDSSLRISIPELVQQQALLQLYQHGLTSDNPYILLNPWTSCPSRNYSSERFAIAARELAEITGYPIIVTGVAKDLQHSAALFKTLGTRAINLIGTTNLTELAALIANAKLMLSNNTSTMHLADATRTPSVILFAGTEHESQWQPRHTAAHLLRQPTACSPCYAFTCPYNLECLDIPPEQVVAAGLKLLHRPIAVVD